MLLEQLGHVRLAVLESPLNFWPLPQVGCALQLVLRCDDESWYVLLEQTEHVRMAVVMSPLIFWPLPQVGCALQLVLRCDDESW